MKNDSLDFNTQISNQDDTLNIDKISEADIQKKNNELFPNNFDIDLNISNIVNEEKNDIKRTKDDKDNINSNIYNAEKSFEESLENFSKINMEDAEIQNETLTNKENDEDKKKTKKKRTKEDLDNTPIPIFECLYCTNEKVVFQHFINEILSEKYLLQTSIYDINDLNKIILNKRLITNKEDKNEKLLTLLIKNTEYLKQYIPKEAIHNYFKSNIFNNLCLKNESDIYRLFKHKIEDSIVRKKKDFYFKGINKIPKNSMNNKCLFNSTNSLINNFNALSGLVEPVQNNANNNAKNNNTIGTCWNNSINFNSLSLNNNEFNYYSKDNNNNMEYIVEKIEKNEESLNYVDDKDLIIDFFKFDLSRKISKKDIIWEKKIYNIWNPEIDSDYDENEYTDDNDYNINKITNDTKNKSINMNINSINSISNKNLVINKSLSNKSMGFIQFHKNKNKNLTFKFNKNKDKSKIAKPNDNDINILQKNIINSINNNISDNISNNNNTFTNNSKNMTKDISDNKYQKTNITNKSITITNIKINKSNEISKNKKPINTKNKNNVFNNRKNIVPGISFLKSFNSIASNSYNVNKSANVDGKSRKKINYSIQNMNKKNKSKSKSKLNIKSLQYMSNSKNSNASTNYSIGISINLKSNSSIKSNGFLQCLNYDNSVGNGIKVYDNNKSINSIKINNKKKSSKNLLKNNNIFNLFNNLNLVNFKQGSQQRVKSNYKIKSKNEKIKNRNPPKSSKSIHVFKNKNKKNNYNIYKKNKMNKQKLFNFSSDRQIELAVPCPHPPHFPSSNSKRIYNNNLNCKSEGLYNENFNSENSIQFNSISNLNKSSSNLNNSNTHNNSKNKIKNLFSPNKFNKTYYYNVSNNKDIKRKLNDLIFLVNKNGNRNYDINYRNNMSDFKNKSINIIRANINYNNRNLKHQKRFIFK